MKLFYLPRSYFHLRGPDAERYLSGQISQDLQKLIVENRSLPACICNAKGKMQAFVYVRRSGDAFLIDAPLELQESLQVRLERYLIADDAELLDVSDRFALIYSQEPIEPDFQPVNRFGEAGYERILDQAAYARFRDQHKDAIWLEADDLESTRIRNGFPKWGCELTEETLPPEARLEALAISYSKGCYVGQEVISRMKSAGRVNRTLLSFKSDSLIAPNTEFFTSKGKTAGHITSSCSTQDGNCLLLGYLKRQTASESTFFTQSGIKLTPIKNNDG